MEKSKKSSDIIALGKLLVKELQLDQSTDTLGRWMTHHVAEVMEVAEKATGQKKFEAEDRCREVILSLWEHIRAFPGERHPLADIESLLATIQALDPDNSAYFYQSVVRSQLHNSTLSEETKKWLELARGIDYSARLLIDMCLKKAASDIAEEKRDYLELARSLDADIPITRAIRVFMNGQKRPNEEIKSEELKKAIVNLKNRRERLKGMVVMSEKLISSIDDDIEGMELSLRD